MASSIGATAGASTTSEADQQVTTVADDTFTTFTCFSKLSPELREMIWGFACSEPRVIDLWTLDLESELEKFEEYESPENGYWEYFSQAERPAAVLHTSHESRTIGLKHYSLSFETSFEKKIGSAVIKTTTPARVYVNWAFDIVCLMPRIHRVPPIGRQNDDEGRRFVLGVRELRSFDLEEHVAMLAERYPQVRRLAIDCDWDSYEISTGINQLDLDEVFIYQEVDKELYYVFDRASKPNKSLDFELHPMTEQHANQSTRANLHMKSAIIETLVQTMIEATGEEGIPEDVEWSGQWSECRELPHGWKRPAITTALLGVLVDGVDLLKMKFEGTST